MADHVIRFTATTLPVGKQGKLTADENGYYTVVLGGLNAYNSSNELYTLKGVEQMFTSNSVLMRRVREGCLKIELGHPEFKPGMKKEEYFSRIERIDQKNVCGYIAEMWLDYENYRNPDGSKMVAIIGKVCPSGPHGQSLKESLERAGENVCFSVRSFTEDFQERGKYIRVIRRLITFDLVIEPGIYNAKKFFSPALESIVDISYTREMLNKIANMPVLEGVGMESANNTKAAARELLVSRVHTLRSYGERKTGMEEW